tara:strand:+ start:9829 stop:10056 length:228 start_codon:yes stop_codon:yes gene_type:complete
MWRAAIDAKGGKQKFAAAWTNDRFDADSGLAVFSASSGSGRLQSLVSQYIERIGKGRYDASRAQSATAGYVANEM